MTEDEFNSRNTADNVQAVRNAWNSRHRNLEAAGLSADTPSTLTETHQTCGANLAAATRHVANADTYTYQNDTHFHSYTAEL